MNINCANILLIGSGGREHALAWKLTQSHLVKHLYVSPGNAGTQTINKVTNIDLNIKNHPEVITWCQSNQIDLVVIGPEDPLANGLADDLQKSKIRCFGPSQKAAAIESSKSFAKSFMDRHNIPTARWRQFTNPEEAKSHIMSASYDALVIKASGLAAGKGVIVCSSKEEAVKAVDLLKSDKTLSAASDIIVIEELLSGEEISVLCFSDGRDIAVMPPAQDHKRLLDDDKGPNTGGMGAYCPCPLISEQTLALVKEIILQRTISGLMNEGTPFIGVLYAGLMLTKDGPKVLEFNCRFGDPETQVLLPLLQSDLYKTMLACVDGSLSVNPTLQWKTESFAVGVVLVSSGYPGSYPKGKEIKGLNAIEDDLIFHAGTAFKDGKIVTSGGRVLCVVSRSSSLKMAASNARETAGKIKFEGAFYRKDISHKAF